jgi:hypothetical protein
MSADSSLQGPSAGNPPPPGAVPVPPPPPPPVESPYAASIGPAPPRPRRRRLLAGDGGATRFVLVLALLVSFVLSAVTLGTAWWSYTYSNGNTTQTDLFDPGSTYSVMCTGSGCGSFASGSFSYSDFGGTLGVLYGSLEGLLIVAVVFAGLATLFGLVMLFGRGGRAFAILAFLLGLVAGGLLLAASLWVESSQPSAFGSGAAFPGLRGGGVSPSTSFWGTSSGGGAVPVWGAGVGWYCALIAGVLLIAIAISLLFLRSTNPARAARPAAVRSVPAPSRAEVIAAAPMYAPPPPAHGPPPPTAAAEPINAPVQASAKTPVPILRAKPVAAEPDAMVDCPSCGYQNSSRARTCSYCQRSLRAPT